MSATGILVVLSRQQAAAGCLRAAAEAVPALPGARITVLQVRPDPSATILPSEEVLTTERLAILQGQLAEERAALHAAYDAWRPAAPDSDWVEAEGVPAEQVLARARAAALAVMALPGPHAPHLQREAFDAVLFGGFCPVLAVPAGWNGQFGRHLAIGWRDSPSTRAALAASESWLAQAAHITVIEVGEKPSGMTPPLPPGWRGKYDALTVPATAQGDGAALLHAAAQAGADGLVLGAYRRGRLLEWALGGVTEHVLRHATLPLLLKH